MGKKGPASLLELPWVKAKRKDQKTKTMGKVSEKGFQKQKTVPFGINDIPEFGSIQNKCLFGLHPKVSLLCSVDDEDIVTVLDSKVKVKNPPCSWKCQLQFIFR